jgi:hypothetical protein
MLQEKLQQKVEQNVEQKVEEKGPASQGCGAFLPAVNTA